MSIDFELDLTELIRMLKTTPEAAFEGAKTGLHDAMDDWLTKSRDVAPLDKGNLRKQMHTEVDDKRLTGAIHANAIESSPKYGRFNYAYWLHETSEGQATTLHTPGTIHKFLEAPAVQNRDRWLKHIESEVKAAVMRRGW